MGDLIAILQLQPEGHTQHPHSLGSLTATFRSLPAHVMPTSQHPSQRQITELKGLSLSNQVKVSEAELHPSSMKLLLTAFLSFCEDCTCFISEWALQQVVMELLKMNYFVFSA